MLRCFIVLIALLVVGCSSNQEAPACKGAVVALNVGHWTPTPVDMSDMAKICKDER